MTGHRPWKEIRAVASPEALESAERIVSGRVEIERQLRERLTAHRTLPGILNEPLSAMQIESLTAALLPWVLELVEEREWMAGNLTERLP